MNHRTRNLSLTCLLAGLAISSVIALADDGSGQGSINNDGTDAQSSPAKARNKKSGTENDTVDAENNRMQSLAGSSSRWSGQFNLTYTGPAVSNPIGSIAPNPLRQVPAPLVQLSGNVGIMYRLDPASTLAFGTGIMVYTPFNNPTGWSASDPYLNYNRLFKTGPVHHYLTVGGTVWTDNQYFTQDGYRFGLNLNDQSYYVFKFGLTAGLNLWATYNTFASGAQYNPSQQVIWNIGGGPYLEYSLSQNWNLRTVLGVTGDHTSAAPGGAVVWENPYQTLGVGVQIIRAWFVYLYVQASPYSGDFTSQNTGLGFNTIINLF